MKARLPGCANKGRQLSWESAERGRDPHLHWGHALILIEGLDSIQPSLNSAASTGNFFMVPACAPSLQEFIRPE